VIFKEKLALRVKENNAVLKGLGGKPVNAAKILADYTAAARVLKPFVTNTVTFLHKAMAAKKELLFEGAQGTFLDIDHGTYPFVTSSNTTSGGACTGSGVAPNRIDCVVGVVKAYTTRVGEGPFPTEEDSISDMLHGMGREFGSTTGRARRCGWFDAVAARYATMVNGVDELAITNLDGLDGLDEIKVCTGYRLDGKGPLIDTPPSDAVELGKPVGRDVALDRPSAARQYGFSGAVRRFEDLVADAMGAIPNCPGAGALRGMVQLEARRLVPQEWLKHAA
jgi:adenylosuccinate synthase